MEVNVNFALLKIQIKKQQFFSVFIFFFGVGVMVKIDVALNLQKMMINKN